MKTREARGKAADGREKKIEMIISTEPVDLDALRAVSRLPGGYLNSRMRQQVWPRLLNINARELKDYRTYIPANTSYNPAGYNHSTTESNYITDNVKTNTDTATATSSSSSKSKSAYSSKSASSFTSTSSVKSTSSSPKSPKHRDAYQLHADVDRSLWSIKQIESWSVSLRDKKRGVLHDLIMSNLCKNSQLFYYQGFHDIVSVLYLVLGDEKLAFAHIEAVSTLFLIDYMNKDFEILQESMGLLFTIIQLYDRPLYDFLRAANLQPYFATSWLITWFSHDDRDLDSISRIFDALLCSHPAFCFYISAAYVIGMREKIFQLECEFAELHNFLVHAPREEGFDWERTLSLADELFLKIPIHDLLTRCDELVWKLIKDNKMNALSKTHIHSKYTDSDWVLIQHMRNCVMRWSSNLYEFKGMLTFVHSKAVLSYLSIEDTVEVIKVRGREICHSMAKDLPAKAGQVWTRSSILWSISVAVAVVAVSAVVGYHLKLRTPWNLLVGNAE